jgi:hypothetical protein
MKYVLANDADGNPLDVPEMAVAWRVRRGGGRRGRPQIVFDSETGTQLEVPLEVTIQDLIDHGCPPGRYRLEAVDSDGKLIAGVVAVTEVPIEIEEEEQPRPVAKTKKWERHLQTVERAMDTLQRTVEAMARGYGPVSPAQPVPIVLPEMPVVADQGKNVTGEAIKEAVLQGLGLLTQMWQAKQAADAKASALIVDGAA